MLRLGLTTDPIWIDLPGGARIQCKPPSTSTVQGVRDALTAPQSSDEDEDAAPGRPPMVVWVKAVAQAAIIAWEGIGDANGKPVDVTDDAVSDLMEIAPVYSAFVESYINRAYAVADEGND